MGRLGRWRASRRVATASRRLRREMTDGEARLWQFLRGRRLDGLRFRRQHAFGSFILDFYCPECRLAIELDGAVHADPDQHQHDIERQAALEAEGIAVLRFTNTAIEQNLPAVLAEIAQRARAARPLSTP